MNLQTERKNIKKQMDYIHDKRVINSIKNILDFALSKEVEVVGYEPGGKPITKAQLIKDIEESEQQIKRGKYITQEQLEKEIKKW